LRTVKKPHTETVTRKSIPEKSLPKNQYPKNRYPKNQCPENQCPENQKTKMGTLSDSHLSQSITFYSEFLFIRSASHGTNEAALR
jgi:hypothetical protein